MIEYSAADCWQQSAGLFDKMLSVSFSGIGGGIVAGFDDGFSLRLTLLSNKVSALIYKILYNGYMCGTNYI